MSDLVTLKDCPAGPFFYENLLYVKTAFQSEFPIDSGKWWSEAFCMRDGQQFMPHKGYMTSAQREELLVLPVDPGNIIIEEPEQDAQLKY